jgi:hypothetical protein
MDKREEADIVDILHFWEMDESVPEQLGPYLAVAADEIAGLRAENEYLHGIIDNAAPHHAYD